MFTHLKRVVTLTILLVLAITSPTLGQKVDSTLVYYGQDHFLIGGTSTPDSLKECAYDRLPVSMKNEVRPPVWDLSKNSAGITVSFMTDSPSLSVRWSVLKDFTMNHMAPSGIKGIDLYLRHEGSWRYVNTGRPTGIDNEANLLEGIAAEMREFRMYLPLYDGVTNLEIGIGRGYTIRAADTPSKKPIVFYGTSITQGGCASRPGMAHTNIISRKLDQEVINFGFSGNGRMEPEIVEHIAEIDAAFFVIECLQNISSEQIVERTGPLVKALRKRHPKTPILLGNNMMYEGAFLDENLRDDILNENILLAEEFEKLASEGIEDIYYIDNTYALGKDHEGTVDGVHLTDLGFSRMAEHLIANFRKVGVVD